ncbi:MAG: hypothetical protein U0797_18585 [Gemmataceae bacterium]
MNIAAWVTLVRPFAPIAVLPSFITPRTSSWSIGPSMCLVIDPFWNGPAPQTQVSLARLTDSWTPDCQTAWPVVRL